MKQEFKAKVITTVPNGVRTESLSDYVIKDAEMSAFDSINGEIMKGTYMIIILQDNSQEEHIVGQYVPLAFINHKDIANEKLSVHELMTCGGSLFTCGQYVEIEIIK